MSRTIRFLAVEHVIAIHRRMVEEFGGDPGLRDRGLLESAVAMPAARIGGKFLHRGIAEKASAYLFHLCRNHAFLDGNKRTALASAEVFLLLNGYRFDASDEQLEELTVGVAGGTVAKDEVATFVRRHMAPTG